MVSEGAVTSNGPYSFRGGFGPGHNAEQLHGEPIQERLFKVEYFLQKKEHEGIHFHNEVFTIYSLA